MAEDPLPALRQVVDVDHRRLHELLVELRRMPITPGVVAEISQQLQREISVHCSGLRRLTEQLRVDGGTAVDGGLTETAADLHQRLLVDPDFDVMAAALADHVDACEALIADLGRQHNDGYLVVAFSKAKDVQAGL